MRMPSRGFLLTLLIIAVAVLLVSLFTRGNAQPYDYGVVYSCSHAVDNSFEDYSGVEMTARDDSEYVVVTMYRDYSGDSEMWVWESLSTVPNEDDRIYLQFPGNDIYWEVYPTEVGVDEDWAVDYASFWAEPELVDWFFAYMGELEVTFSGMWGMRTFVIEEATLSTLAAGFWTRCLLN